MTHTWEVHNLERVLDGNVVTKIYFRVYSEENGIFKNYFGEHTITGSASDPNFIPFENLTQNVVVEWLKSGVDVTAIQTINEDRINEEIAAYVAPTTEEGTPWG